MRVLGAPFSGAHLIEGLGGGPANVGVFAVRDPRTAVDALMAAWESGRFACEPQPPGWWGDPWSFDLIDGWQGLVGRPLSVVCARQWLTLQLNEFNECGPGYVHVTFEDLVADPRSTESWLAALTGKPVRVLLDQPDAPWLCLHDPQEVAAGLAANEALVDEYLDLVDVLVRNSSFTGPLGGSAAAGYRLPLPAEEPTSMSVTRPSEGTRFNSRYTASVPEFLAAAGASLIITTYKSGHAVVARTQSGSGLDTHFTRLDRPMGVAVSGNRVAIGAADCVAVFARHDEVAGLVLDPTGDAVLVPKATVFTGDVAVHELAWDADGTLWFVNTRFSCLSTLQLYASFDCAWKPPWISRLAGEDRCHLNGLAMEDGRPAFVTALSMADTPGGWRDHRALGGVIVDVRTNEVVADGLCMPHSPRWHHDRLWFLQSGTGTLSVMDRQGNVSDVARLPGFTRGLAFLGPFALVGLSQVRETVFADLPITSTSAERNCGVWIVDTRTGEVMGFLRFEGAVTEIFDVQTIAARWPQIADEGGATSSCYALDEQTLALVTEPAGEPA